MRVIDDEVLSGLRVARRPIEVDEEMLALDVVKSAGPGGGSRPEQLESHEPPDGLDPVVRRQLDAYCLD